MNAVRGVRLLDEALPALRGLSERTASRLAKWELYTCRDLLRFFPRAYEDWGERCCIAGLQADMDACFIAQLSQEARLFRRGRFSSVSSVLEDASGHIKVVWFNQAWLATKLRRGARYLFRGRVRQGRYGLELNNPSYVLIDESPENSEPQAFMKAIYPLTAGLRQTTLRRAVADLLDRLQGEVPEVLTDTIRRRRHLCAAAYAYEEIHRPRTPETRDCARRRMAYEELFLLQAALRLRRKQVGNGARALPLPLSKTGREAYLRRVAELPYTLTKAQRRVLNEIACDLGRSRPMNRLVQGDVGSGKTIVAALAMYQAALAGCQSVLMAPTSILAQQHLLSVRGALQGSGCRVEILTGGMPARERRAVLQDLADGTIDMLIGTHAVIQNDVVFHALGLAITDEQHRFGVRQRRRLSGDETVRPHVLVMSATPIPRSLALVIYGDLDVSVLDERPPGRQRIQTRILGSADEGRLFAYMKARAREGEQSYVVCPSIREGGTVDAYAALETTFERFQKEIFPELRVGKMTGELSEKEKQAVMEAFYARDLDILVSTTVVEVGLDNPNATTMVILDAERFGLAQLHQLRGRIGRGEKASRCFLLSDSEDPLVRERLQTLCENDDGFRIAEADLKLRGPGEFFGTRQHGLPELRLANLYEDRDLILQSREDLERILTEDPGLVALEHRELRAALNTIYREALDRVD